MTDIENLSRFVQMRGIKSNVVGFAGTLSEVGLGYATDTDELGIYVTGAWTWLSANATGTTTYLRVGTPVALSGATGTYWKIPEGTYATGTLMTFINGVAQSPVIDYSEQYYYSGSYQLTAMPPTGSVHVVIWGAPKPNTVGASTWADVGARAYNSTNINVSGSMDTPVLLNSERWDTDNIHNTGTATSRLTCVTPGTYSIIGHVQINTSGTNTLYQAYIKYNNTTDIGRVSYTCPPASSVRLNVSTIYKLAAADYVELYVFQNSGMTLPIVAAGNRSPEFMMQKIG